MKNYPQAITEMLESGNVKYAYLILLDFDTAPMRLALTGFNVNYGGDTYFSTPMFNGMDSLSRSSAMEVTEMNMSFSMAEQTMTAIVLNYDVEFTPVKIGRVYFDESNNIIKDDQFREYYEKVWSGRITSNGDDEGDGIVTTTISNIWADFENANPWRTNPESQERRHTGDNCFKFAAKAGETIYWGGELSGGNRVTGGGDGKSDNRNLRTGRGG